MRVYYQCGFATTFSEWVCFEHTGYPRRKAEAWWVERSNEPVPATVEEAVDIARCGDLARTMAITVQRKPGEKYDEGRRACPRPQGPAYRHRRGRAAQYAATHGRNHRRRDPIWSRNTITSEIARFLTYSCNRATCLRSTCPSAWSRAPAYTSTVSGYFTHVSIEDSRLVDRRTRSSRHLAPGVHHAQPRPTGSARPGSEPAQASLARNGAADGDILARRWLLIDVDPVRPSGVSSTDEGTRTRGSGPPPSDVFLSTLGWPEPIVAMSGNGYRLLYRIDLPVDDAELSASLTRRGGRSLR
ncbi:MAG: hypothetical protein M5U09_28010 [Gammaproteobacteria bacterium]|nr:hypothetical protein [Gammaproteobacteria bacterium]